MKLPNNTTALSSAVSVWIDKLRQCVQKPDSVFYTLTKIAQKMSYKLTKVKIITVCLYNIPIWFQKR